MATPLLGRIAVQKKLINLDQLAEATREQGRREGARLGDILIELGFVDREQMAQLVEIQRQIVIRHRAQRAAQPHGVDVPPAPAAQPRAADAAIAPAQPRDVDVATAPVAPPRAAQSPALDSAELDALLRAGVERGASDIHLHCGAPLQYRVAGALVEVESAVLDGERARRLLTSALSTEQRERLEREGELDLCHVLPGVGRFRANLYRQQRGLDGVFRYVPPQPLGLEELGLPSSLARFANYHQGLVLVTGPTGCGKSSTLAALVDLINEERKEHILTIEDPIEYLHVSKRCLVNQRSVQSHTGSFARALRAALREDPDVIAIGELRDLETISLALTAAETGHFVLATLHTEGAIRTIDRLVGAFPSEQHAQVRTRVSESLRAVISQRLIPRADGRGRAAALETLVVTKAVGNLIREAKSYQIHSILQTGASQGMGLLDESIRRLVQSGAVTRQEALRYCSDSKSLGN